MNALRRGVVGFEARKAPVLPARPAPRPALAAAIVAAFALLAILLAGAAGLTPRASAWAEAHLEAPASPWESPAPMRLLAIASPTATAVSTEPRRRLDGADPDDSADAQFQPPGAEASFCARTPAPMRVTALPREFTPRCARAPPA